MREWPEKQIQPVRLHSQANIFGNPGKAYQHRERPLGNIFDDPSLADNRPEKPPANNRRISGVDSAQTENEDNATYLGALRLMLQFFYAGKSPEQIQAFFASRRKFFPLIFIQLLLGGDGGLTSIPGFNFSSMTISSILTPDSPSSLACGQLRMAPPTPHHSHTRNSNP